MIRKDRRSSFLHSGRSLAVRRKVSNFLDDLCSSVTRFEAESKRLIYSLYILKKGMKSAKQSPNEFFFGADVGVVGGVVTIVRKPTKRGKYLSYEMMEKKASQYLLEGCRFRKCSPLLFEREA